MSIPHWVWGLWAGSLAFVFVCFGIIEGIAIANGGSRDTLSEAIWDHSHLPAAVVFMLAGVVVFTTVWFLIHVVSKGRLGI